MIDMMKLGNLQAWDHFSWRMKGAMGDCWERPSTCCGHKYDDVGDDIADLIGRTRRDDLLLSCLCRCPACI